MAVFEWMILLKVLFLIVKQISGDASVTKHPGHLKPFGFTGKWNQIEQISVFPNTTNFFNNYVKKSKPVIMAGVVKDSKAYKLWSDEYFIAMNIPKNETIEAENAKKENRSKGIQNLHFHDFVKKYNNSNIYMVHNIPHYLGRDVELPEPLHCKEIYESGHILQIVMWFSSGGTKSVVHTDAFENIICVYSGQKEFVFVNPHKYKHKVDIDHPEEGYSDIDIDEVNFTKYPDLVDVEYHKVNLTAGDCLYVPYKWIHQVRSYGRNIAINTWWNHRLSRTLDLQRCENETKRSVTLDQVAVTNELSDELSNVEDTRDYLNDLVLVHCISHETLCKQLLLIEFKDKTDELLKEDKAEIKALLETIKILDIDSDGQFCYTDIENITDDDLQRFNIKKLAIFESLEEGIQENLDDHDEL